MNHMNANLLWNQHDNRQSSWHNVNASLTHRLYNNEKTTVLGETLFVAPWLISDGE
jgi:outer membrane usher protein FimD/PapC